MDILYEQAVDNTTHREENIACIPIVNGKEQDETIPIRLPTDIRSKHYNAIDEGTVLLNITQASFRQGSNTIQLQSGSKYLILDQVPKHLRHLTTEPGRRLNKANGTKTVAILRVTMNDSTPTPTKAQLEALFNSSAINFVTQYDRCSMGQLNYTKSPFGVVDVFIDEPVSRYVGALDLVNRAQAVARANMGLGSIRDLADTILVCLPPGTGDWVASAGLNHWRAQFNDIWALSLTATMHEIGHTLGLLHSNRDSRVYADSTGYMSRGVRTTDGPLRCFNGQNHDYLGWFDSHKAYVTPAPGSPSLILLAAFVDHEKAHSETPLLVNVADELFLLYNRAKSYNNGTGAALDTVTVTTKPVTGGTELLAGLKAGEKLEIANWNNSSIPLVIEVCRKINGSQVMPDAMIVAINLGTANLCAFVDDEIGKTGGFDPSFDVTTITWIDRRVDRNNP